MEYYFDRIIVTKYHKLGASTAETYCFRVWRLGIPNQNVGNVLRAVREGYVPGHSPQLVDGYLHVHMAFSKIPVCL